MADPLPLTPQDFEAWHLASPLQLLHLIKRLGVESTVIATWLGVKPAAVSQWNRQRREIPARYGPALLVWAKDTVEKAAARTEKEVRIQPTAELQRAVQGEFAALWTRWKLEVVHNAGTIRKVIKQNYQALGQFLSHDPLTEADADSIEVVMATLSQQVAMVRTLQGETPSGEEALLARLQAAHEAHREQD